MVEVEESTTKTYSRSNSALQQLPRGLDELEKICTIGKGTFGRVLLVKFKDQHLALKTLTMADIVSSRQLEHVFSERDILSRIHHPKWSCKDKRSLYLLFEYVPGGELFSYLRMSRRFGNRMTRFYASEIVTALEYLHDLNIVYRDLKPENLLLSKDGHVKITDFGFSKELADRTWTLCGTTEYIAPEIILNKGHNKAVDWWALGVLIFEMHAGTPPFRASRTTEVYDQILRGQVQFPKHFHPVAKDLCRKLLQVDRTLRIGCMKNGVLDLKQHKWFASVDWDAVIDKSLKPPIVPTLFHDGDTGNFDVYEEEEVDEQEAIQKVQDLFREW